MPIRNRIPRRFAPVVFGFFLSGIMTLVVSAVTTYRNLGTTGFVGHWLTAYVSAWPITFPTATLVAPLVRKFVEHLLQPVVNQTEQSGTH